jgi:hypothetical protein
MDNMTADQIVEIGKRLEKALQSQEKSYGRPLTNPEKKTILKTLLDAFIVEQGIIKTQPLVENWGGHGLH